jgi:hypothetical protein
MRGFKHRDRRLETGVAVFQAKWRIPDRATAGDRQTFPDPNFLPLPS